MADPSRSMAALLEALSRQDSPLHAVLRGSVALGPDSFRAMTESLARGLGVDFAVIAEYLPELAKVRTLAFWGPAGRIDDTEWSVAGTPCARVVEGGEFAFHPEGLQAEFPDDRALVELGAHSYMGVPLRGAEGNVLGHLFVMDRRPMTAIIEHLATFHIFAARAASELVRMRLEAALAASEERFRDLFDEAPIAYVHEGIDSRFLRANRTAMRILGITADQVEGTYGKTFVPDTPDAQARLHAAFESIGQGTDTSGVVLELRRRDNGAPIFIQWWSRPAPDRSYTRTMFLDITDEVMKERERQRLAAQNAELREQLRAAENFGDIVGASPGLMRVLERVDRVAPTDSTALIHGETGTGKELVARSIHQRSRRASAAFVKVNCAALPAGLVESEFFGHEKGAFTGAVSARRGRFELADGGTIFLDEVGEISPEVQVKLLRVLQESEFERVGGSQTIRVNVRVIAATNRDLATDVAEGRFRADLYYRLNVFPIAVPPLRERPTDIPLLARHFVVQLAASVGRRVDSIAPETLAWLGRQTWPGNIRELRNVLERAVILGDSDVLRIEPTELGFPAEDHAPQTGTVTTASEPPGGTLEEVERAHIVATLARTGGAIAGPGGAARLLGVPPSTLRSRMQRLGIT